MSGVRHLYVHLPFCAHRCGYCDFVTLVGRPDGHGPYVDALLAELRLEGGLLADEVETVYLGGGTPTFTEPEALARLLAALPIRPSAEVTVEANPETVTPALAARLRRHGATRVSLGAQSFQPELLAGIPGQSPSDLERDLAEAIALGPEHLSCYELEAKPGTRFTHAHGEELARQADAMEGYFELVVKTLRGVGYRWYETANFCREDCQAHHNVAYWQGRDYLGIGIGAVSTVCGLRWRNRPSLGGYLRALADGRRPPREEEPLDPEVKSRERLMLGLRLDEPVALSEVADAVDGAALARMERLGLARQTDGGLTLTTRGRFLGGGVTAELLVGISAESPAKSTI